MASARPAIALTMGDPAGIGPEIAIKAWRTLARSAEGPAFFLIGDIEHHRRLAIALGVDVPLVTVADGLEAGDAFAHALPILPVAVAAAIETGRPSIANAKAVIAAIDRGIDLTRSGRASALVTNPIHKATLLSAGFPHPGHTEYLGARMDTALPVMMLANAMLRVIPVTVHVSLAAAIRTLTTDRIVATARVAARALIVDFGISAPRLAIAGLNPHAGESGALGNEDAAIVAPAIEQLHADGIAAFGPEPPDTMFHAAARARYDAAICLYHDQALIPVKTIDFDGTVNVTLGLPIVRTSPDHGTAFDIAGRGVARPDSLIAALRLAARISAQRSIRAGS